MDREVAGLLDLPAYQAVGQVVRSYLHRTHGAVRRLGGEADEEALHDFRVGLRRLRTTLQTYRPYLSAAVSPKLMRHIRDLAASTSEGRDAEVQLAWLEPRAAGVSAAEVPGVDRLREELIRRKAEGYAELAGRATRRFAKLRKRLRARLEDLEATIDAAGLAPAVPFRASVHQALAAAGEQLEVRLSRVHSPADTAEAHQARIRAKRVRYVLEPIAGEVDGAAGLIAELQHLQDLTGDLRDAQLLDSVASLVADRMAAEGTIDVYGPGLDRVKSWLAEDQELLFSRLRAAWLGSRGKDFFEALAEVAERIGGTAVQSFEIERKYLLAGLPPGVEGHPTREIDQGYLPGAHLQERVRRLRADGREWYARAVKVGSGIRRIELQEETGREVFEALWPLTEGRRVAKIRYLVPAGDLVWEIDRFTDRDLVLAEVELPSDDVRPPVPEWLAPYVVREVTGEPEYLNVNLAQ